MQRDKAAMGQRDKGTMKKKRENLPLAGKAGSRCYWDALRSGKSAKGLGRERRALNDNVVLCLCLHQNPEFSGL